MSTQAQHELENCYKVIQEKKRLKTYLKRKAIYSLVGHQKSLEIRYLTCGRIRWIENVGIYLRMWIKNTKFN